MNKEYRLKVSFLNRVSETVSVSARDNLTAIMIATQHFKGEEIIGVKITYIEI